jgi:hypothetical protein
MTNVETGDITNQPCLRSMIWDYLEAAFAESSLIFGIDAIEVGGVRGQPDRLDS